MVWSFTAVLGPEIWSSQVDYMPPEAWLETQCKKNDKALYHDITSSVRSAPVTPRIAKEFWFPSTSISVQFREPDLIPSQVLEIFHKS